MLYKIFLVEDEIVTREGIRDNVHWESAGFEFCGEAQDGEVALPLIVRAQPDVLITDIKMPFMDGLQLSEILKAQMPWLKIIILSGHDEFEYAQSAVKLGVSQYLLKPISAQEIHSVLLETAAKLDQETAERANLRKLQNQVNELLALKRERLLLQLLVGDVSSTEVIEQYRQLGISIVAQCYLVVLIKVNLLEGNGQLDRDKHQRIQAIVSGIVNNRAGAFSTQKSFEELLLIMTGEDPDLLKQDALILAELIQKEIQERVGCRVKIGVGDVRRRLTNIHFSLSDALAMANSPEGDFSPEARHRASDLIHMTSLDQSAFENYLQSGLLTDYDQFYAEYLQPIGDVAVSSTLVKHYLLVDILLTSAQLIDNLGGDSTEVLPAIADVEGFLVNLRTAEQIRDAITDIVTCVLTYRDALPWHGNALLVLRASSYIDAHYAEPNLLLDDVAASVNLSPSHFSLVFGRVTGQSFKSYLTNLRIDHAKQLLRTTSLKCSDIAFQSGYNDPQYFSYVFKKNVGLPPYKFRSLTH